MHTEQVPPQEEGISEAVQRLIGSNQHAQRTRKSRVFAAQIRELQSNDSLADSYVIVDVRSKAESDVSVIPGAITKTEFEQNADQYADKAVITYCTIGFRAGMYAWGLKRKGFNALNYRGSILDWCKNGLPLTTLDGEEIKRVHTYSRWLSVPKEYIAVNRRNRNE